MPVETSISPSPAVDHLNLVEMVRWAEDNPEIVAGIVDEAREFVALHLSELGQTCYMARLLLAYSDLLTLDVDRHAVNMTAAPSARPLRSLTLGHRLHHHLNTALSKLLSRTP